MYSEQNYFLNYTMMATSLCTRAFLIVRIRQGAAFITKTTELFMGKQQKQKQIH